MWLNNLENEVFRHASEPLLSLQSPLHAGVFLQGALSKPLKNGWKWLGKWRINSCFDLNLKFGGRGFCTWPTACAMHGRGRGPSPRGRPGSEHHAWQQENPRTRRELLPSPVFSRWWENIKQTFGWLETYLHILLATNLSLQLREDGSRLDGRKDNEIRPICESSSQIV